VGIRVLVVDDNPHVRWRGQVYPVNATFHRFLAAFLDLPGGPVESIAHAVPLRELPDDAPAPMTLPLDPRIRTVATAPFDGIAGFLRHAPAIVRANRPILDREVGQADLVWIKVPASNAALAAGLAVRRGVPRFVWVAGTARHVASARFSGPSKAAAMLVGGAYDLIGRLAGIGGARIIVGRSLIHGPGVVTSPVDPQEIRDADRPWPRKAGQLTIAWAGRLAEGKGLETVLAALAATPHLVSLDVLGEGPDRAKLVARAADLGVANRVNWRGYVADRREYLSILAKGDIFAFPSAAEGFPKVVLDAFAAGLPVIASPVGALTELGAAGIVELVRASDAQALAVAVRSLSAQPRRAVRLRASGVTFAAAHTRHAEAGRLVARWQVNFPWLAWR
jgi:glycosyltransferase involved in cell wall biosynthesis